MINRYIKELLNDHNRVIVPDLGAFLYKGESSKTMYFNEFLRFNDGLLLNYIAEQTKMDKIEAAKQIKAYVEETNKNLQAKKKVVIEGIGYLYLDENDKIQLQSDIIPEPQTDGLQDKSSFTIEETKVPETIEPIFTSEKYTDEPKSEVKSSVSFDFPENKRDQTLPEVKSDKSAFQASSRTQVKSAPSASRKKNTVPPAKNRTFLWIASIAVIIIISLLYLFIIKPLYQNNTISKKAGISNANLDTIVNANTVADSTKDNIKSVTKTAPIETSRHKYRLVVGCFVQENNADKVVQKLINQGFSAEKFAKIEQMYFVSIASFSNKASAEKYLRELKSKGHKEVWIKYY
ncbi:MAG TPA: SPOR domain-containing protein [Bacteroidales bacterium]|nr:SPOR domain-containing protein [Bacteroidales bacterium]